MCLPVCVQGASAAQRAGCVFSVENQHSTLSEEDEGGQHDVNEHTAAVEE